MEKKIPATDRDIEVATTLRTVIHRLVKLLRRQTHTEGELSLTERSVMGSLYSQGELAPSALAQLEKEPPDADEPEAAGSHRPPHGQDYK